MFNSKRAPYYLPVVIAIVFVSCKNPSLPVHEVHTEEDSIAILSLLDELVTQLPAISSNIEKKQLGYSSAKGQDCSGIFHQINDSIQLQNKNLISKESYIFPKKDKSRSSKQIALWYYQNENFTIVPNSMDHTEKIIPGAVLFFGHSGRKYSPTSIEELTSSKNGIINHIAIVTSVKRDSDNRLIEYTMMHAHNKKKPASRSTSKEIQSNYRDLPAFGNWSQQLVGIAMIFTEAQVE